MIEPDELPHGAFSPDQPPDQAARRAALDPAGSFAVAAPAGSGKTGLLTQRVLTLLAHCRQPEELLAITFTRKAAGEMQERIMMALRQAHHAPCPDNPHDALTWQLAWAVLERDKGQAWQLLLSPQRLRIQTIDSLCRSITRQLPLDSQLGAPADTLETPELAYRQAVHQFLARLETDPGLSRDLTYLVRHLDSNLGSVEGLLIQLLGKRDQWLGVMLEARSEHARDYLESVLDELLEEELTSLQAALGYLASDLCLLVDRAVQNLHKDQPDSPLTRLLGLTELPATQPEALPDWRALADMLLTGKGDWRKRLTKKEGFPAGKAQAHLKERYFELVSALQEQTPDLAEQLHRVRQLPPAHYSAAQWQLLDSLTRLLPVLVAELTVVFKQMGATDYSAIAQAASLALGSEEDPSQLALKLDYRIQHILVDEFQDTAGPQLQLLEKLVAGWQPGDGRSLFIVGDAMQSCYSFRDANVGLFLNARRQGIGSVPLTALDLQVNFRSQTALVRWVNQVFQTAFPSRDDISRGAVRYAPSVAFKPPLPQAAVALHACHYQSRDENTDPEMLDSDAQPDRYLARLQEGEAVAQLASRILAEHPQDNLAILVKSRPQLKEVLPALARRHLRWQATDIDPLESRMAVIDLLSLTRALLNTDDRIAWLSLLRAPWCGLDLHDLHRLVTADLGDISPRSKQGWPVLWQQLRHYRDIDGLSASGQACLARLMAVLEPAWRERHRKPLRTWLEGTWLALGGPALLADPGDADNLPSYFDLLEQHQLGGGLRDWDAFELAVQRLYAAPRADADPRLQVMTLHKSKGLEFDRVIIPGLDRGSNRDDKQLLLWQERLNRAGQSRLMLGPLAPTGAEEDELYDFMRQEAKLRRDYEDTRLLYVGCTRAIKQLHLLSCQQLDAKTGELKAPQAASLLAKIWPTVADQWQPAPGGEALVGQSGGQSEVQTGPQSEGRPGLQQILRLPPDWQAVPIATDDLLKAYRGHEYDDPDNRPEPESPSARLARHIGSVLHGQLQQLVEQGPRDWSEAWADQRQPFWALQLRQLGWTGEPLQLALGKIRRGLRLTLEDPRGRWLLDPSHEDSRCEWSLYHRQGSQYRESIIDRSFIDSANRQRWIVDYKTGQPAEDESPEGFVKRERAEHQAQLQRYRQVLNRLGETQIVAALYFPLLEDSQRLWCYEPEQAELWPS